MKKVVKLIYYFLRNKDKLGLSLSSFLQLKRFSQHYYADMKTEFFGREITFSSPFWFLHSVEEVFVSEVYKFPKTDRKLEIIDCGANIGLSVIYLKKLFPNSRITALEPDRGVFAQLEKNVESFGFSDVHLLEAAAWINNDDLVFNSEGSVGGQIASKNDTYGKKITVKAIRLRDMLASKVDFLKLDIEGAEYDVLKDCRDKLRNVDNLFIEFHTKRDEENHLAEILSWVDEAGFTYYIKEAWNNMLHPFTQVDSGGYHMQLNIFCYRRK